MSTSLNLRPGELVEVRSEAEILATLDATGALDGLPFMPEMLAFCGQRLRVDKRADKACDTINYSGNRRMHDTVLLTGGRCTGQAHGGCQAGCLLFWKEGWLRRVDAGAGTNGHAPASRPPAACTRDGLLDATRKPSSGGEVRYRCQATDLLLATSPMAWWDPRQYLRDARSRNVRVRELLGAAGYKLFTLALRVGGYRALVALYNRLQTWRGGQLFPFPLANQQR